MIREEPRAGSAGRWPEEKQQRETGMATGTVKWFNPEKGFGFISPDDGSGDIFAHYTGIAGNGYRSREENQKVQYEVGQGAKGPVARTSACNSS
jgi:CspA family cold shock protein